MDLEGLGWVVGFDLLGGSVGIFGMVWWCEREGFLECLGERRGVVGSSFGVGKDLLEGFLLGVLE